jgi:hypothetical protein
MREGGEESESELSGMYTFSFSMLLCLALVTPILFSDGQLVPTSFSFLGLAAGSEGD